MIKTVVFDIGNVVWRYRPLQTVLFRRWGKILNISVSDFRKNFFEKDNLYRSFEVDSLNLSSWFKTIAPQTNPRLLLSVLDDVYGDSQIFSKYLNYSVISLIKNIRRQGITVGCLSNTENYFYPYLKKNIISYFDYSILSWQSKSRKPDPDIYQQIFKYVSCNPSEVLFIDDVPNNTLGAQKVGLNTILFQNYTQLKKELVPYLIKPNG